jgi:thioredoxin-related protein
MMKNWFKVAVAAVACLMPATAAEWMTDFAAAKEKAVQENKAVLVDFTGSDWCHFCIVLRRRVLDTPAFADYGADKFVYLEVDLPRTTRLPKELMEQNNALVKAYGVGGFPTVILLDGKGHALGGFTGGMTRLPDVIKALEPAW